MKHHRPRNILNHRFGVQELRDRITGPVLCSGQRQNVSVLRRVNEHLASVASVRVVAGSDRNAGNCVLVLLYADYLRVHQKLQCSASACLVNHPDQCFLPDVRLEGRACSGVPVARSHRFPARVVIALYPVDELEVYSAFLSAHVVHVGDTCGCGLASDPRAGLDNQNACSHPCGLNCGGNSSRASSGYDDVVGTLGLPRS